MILATHHHIKSLKEKYDFDFFEDLIDHSYDNEPDQKKRFKLFIDEIKRLYENKENLIEFYKNNQQRFEDNKNKVIDIGKNKSDYYFIKTLLN
jgi:F0F1-type ATP synthase delta subunit